MTARGALGAAALATNSGPLVALGQLAGGDRAAPPRAAATSTPRWSRTWGQSAAAARGELGEVTTAAAIGDHLVLGAGRDLVYHREPFTSSRASTAACRAPGATWPTCSADRAYRGEHPLPRLVQRGEHGFEARIQRAADRPRRAGDASTAAAESVMEASDADIEAWLAARAKQGKATPRGQA